MAITFFDDESESSSQLPFVNEYVRTPGVLGTVFDVESIAPSRKGNGLVLKTDRFIIFVWKKSKICSFILDAVKHGEDDCGYPLVVELRKKDPFYSIGLDTSRTAFFSKEEDDFTGRVSYELVLPPLETSTESLLPQPKKNKKTSPAE
jgi:hypothetical protein